MSKILKVLDRLKNDNIPLTKYICAKIRYTWETKEMERREAKRNKKINQDNQSRLTNKDFSVISINCNGCTICHDLGLRFNSQFVNLWMYPADFITYLKNFDYYNSLPLKFIKEEGIDYPIGTVGGLKVYFTHYHSEEEAEEKWNLRKTRLNPHNIFFMMTDQEGCTLEQMKEFDSLPFKNKVIFTHTPMPEIKSSFYIRGFENDSSVGKLNGYTGKHSLEKWYDQFDYVRWFNNGVIEGNSSSNG